MGIKDVNVLEQHVEKIVIAVAAVGALFMGYLAFQKVTIPETQIGPNDIEPEIAKSLDAMERTQQENLNKPEPLVKVPDYSADYTRLAKGNPLPRDLLDLQIVIGPQNMAPGAVIVTPGEGDRKVVTPKPVQPFKITVNVVQQPVALMDPPALNAGGGAVPGGGGVVPMPGGLTPGVVIATRDQSAAVIEGYIPVGQILLDIFSVKEANARIIDPDRHKAVVSRVHVQRREFLNGAWTSWTDAAPTKAFPQPPAVNWGALDDQALKSTFVQLEEAIKSIALPDFYLNDQGQPIVPPILTRPIPKDVYDQMQKLEKDIASARATWAAAGGGGGFGAGGLGGAGVGGLGGMPGGGGAGGVGGVPGAADPMFPADANTLKQLPIIPFTFWDENVKPDHTYQYQVRIEMVNPTFNWQFGLANPAMKLQGTLDSAWVTTPQVRIHSDLVFYVTGPTDMAGGLKGISAKVYKMTGGKWFVNSNIEAAPGMNIAGRITPPIGTGSPMEVDTNFTVVDVQVKPGGVQVVLKDPAGNLVMRDSGVDRDRDKQDGLMNQLQKAVLPTPTGPDGQPITPTPAGTVTPTTPPPTPTAPPPTPMRPVPVGGRGGG